MPEELDMRIHLRNECYLAGFETMVKPLQLVDNNDLYTQLSVFQNNLEEDNTEMMARFRDAQFDMQDASSCFSMASMLVVDTSAEPFLLSIMQHLLLIRDDADIRPYYYQVYYI